MLQPIRRRVFHERFSPTVVVTTYVATFATSREDTPDPGYHHISFHPRANGPFRDAISVNDLWLEDRDGDDVFASDLWVQLTGQLLDEFEAAAEVNVSVFDPDHPDGGQIILCGSARPGPGRH